MAATQWTVRDLLKVSGEFLKEQGIESPRLCAELLLAHQLGMSRVDLYLQFDRPVDKEETSGYRDLIRRRLKKEPVQYITQKQEFWSLDFTVSPGVLIPRPETELLVEKTLGLFSEGRIPGYGEPRILDLGTGSGAIAVVLARELPGATVLASDISPGALDVARLNAARHGVADRVHLLSGDLFAPFAFDRQAFDVIVSNPPYIPEEDYGTLSPEVREHEPARALNGGRGGMVYVEKILQSAHYYLSSGGWLLLEMDQEQTGRALDIIRSSQCYAGGDRREDYSHRYRIVFAQKA